MLKELDSIRSFLNNKSLPAANESHIEESYSEESSTKESDAENSAPNEFSPQASLVKANDVEANDIETNDADEISLEINSVEANNMAALEPEILAPEVAYSSTNIPTLNPSSAPASDYIGNVAENDENFDAAPMASDIDPLEPEQSDTPPPPSELPLTDQQIRQLLESPALMTTLKEQANVLIQEIVDDYITELEAEFRIRLEKGLEQTLRNHSSSRHSA